MSEPETAVTQQELLIELEKELQYHLEGGTSYRIQTSRFALQVVEKNRDVAYFIDRDSAYNVVAEALPNQDEYRLQDVSKMISVIVRDLELQKTLPPEIKAFADEKMKDFKSLKFK